MIAARPRKSPGRRIPVHAIATLLILWAAGFTLALPAVTVKPHAVAKHGAEAVSARRCIQRHGVFLRYREPSGRVHQLCRTPEGEIFDQIVEWVNGVWEEVTAFKPNPFELGNTLSAIRIWLGLKGAELVTGGL
jgi:putative hemolysin